MRELRRAAAIRIGLPATKPMLEAGPVLFSFRFPYGTAAARQLCADRLGAAR
jgi:hypothetical protein